MVADLNSDLLKEARSGSPSAQCIMGISYYNKTQLENNQELSLYWLRLSAEQGYAPAQWRLGDLYALDGQTAMVELYIKSALQGDTNALERINSWKNDTSLFEKLDLSNQLFLAFCYHHGLFGIRKNKNHASLLYQKSPHSSDAQYQLGLLFCQNKQFQKARSSFEKAACDEKKTVAVNQLAFLYENGLVNAGDNLGKAIELYTRIAKMNDQCDQAILDAKINLARIYRKMNSIDNAIMWYTKALDSSQTEWTRQHQIAKSCLDQLSNQPSINSKDKTLSSRLRQSIAEVSDPEIQSQLKQIGHRVLRRDGTAMYQVSIFYGQGTYFKENQHVSFLWLKNAASVGQCKEAQFSLGKIIHHQGDTKSFIKWYTRAANQGHVEAQYTLGIHYTSLENLKEAYKWLSMAASQNCNDAHYQLGLLCLKHQGLPFECDPIVYFEKAAHQKHVGAIYQLGLCYFEGIGGAQMDRDIGITYYEYCASKDLGDASYALGELYYSGIYLGKNESRAFECFTCAADQGHLDAKYRLAIMYLEEVAVELNYEKAYLLLKDAADANHTMAADIFKTPMVYSLKHPSPVKLYEMFLYISKEGIAKVEYNLGSLCEYGCHNKNTHFGIPKNTQEAVDWYSIAETQHDDVRAQVRLGVLYERGDDDFETNLEASISYYLKAVDQRNPEAMYNLACIYLGKRSPKHAIPHNVAAIKPLVSDPGNASSSSRSFTTVKEFIQKLKEKKNTGLETNGEKASGSSGTPPPLKKITPSLLSFNDKTPPPKKTFSFGSDKPEKTESNTSFFGFGDNESSNIKPESSNTPPPNNNLSFGSDKGAKTESNTSSFSFGGGGNRSTSESSNKIHDTVNPTSTLSESQESPIVSEPSLASEYTGNYNEKESEMINGPEYQNLREAFYLLREAFNMGCRKAAYYMVLSSNKSRPKDPVHIKMFEIIAQEGNVDVQYQLACFYASLESLKAIRWFKMGAKNNIADPFYRLALLYEKEDKDENIPVIVELLQKAANQNHAKALYKLAEMYCSGESVPKDYSKAFDYYQRASQQSHEVSLSIVNGKSNSEKHILLYKHIATTNNNVDIQHMLGSIYENSDSDQDYIEAIKWYEMAAKENHEPSLYRLGEMFQEGLGVEKDIQKAIGYFKRAENQDSSRAMYSLGKIYQFGSGVKIDQQASLKYYKTAADKMNLFAQVKCGELYEHGTMVQKNVIQATRYYQKAYLQGSEEAAIRIHSLYEVDVEKKLSRLLSKIEKYGITDSEATYNRITGRLHFRLATLFYNGVGIQQDLVKAIKSLIVSSEKYQYDLATHFISLEYVKDSDLDKVAYRKKLDMYETAIDILDNQRIYNLAMVYLNGIFVESIQEIKETHSNTENEDQPTNLTEKISIIPNDYAKALKLFSKAGETDHIESLTRIGEIYQDGLGLSKNSQKAAEYHGRSANKRTDKNNYNLGVQYYQDDAYSTAMIYLKKACDQAYYPATRYVGEMYRHGLGITKNFSYAMTFFNKPSNMSADFDYTIGLEYYHGNNIEKELRIAMVYFEKAAAKDHRHALEYLCSLHDDGYSLDLDVSTMESYFNRLVSKKSAGAIDMLDRFKQKLKKDGNIGKKSIQWHQENANTLISSVNKEEGVKYYYGHSTKRDFSTALVYFTKASEQGNGVAQQHLADMYYYGQGVTKNDQLAQKWYTASANQNDTKNNHEKAKRYYIGEGVEQNYLAAFIFFKSAAEQEDTESLEYMGEIYQYGHGVDVNLDIAFKYYKQSSEKKTAKGNYLSGERYYNGRGVEKNDSVAFIFIKKAAEQKDYNACTLLAKMYFYGHGVKEHQALSAYYETKAREYCATETGETKLVETMADWFDYVSNASKPLEWHENFCSGREANEICYIGARYYENAFQEKYQSLAVFYIKKASEKGDPEAQLHLSDMYRNGDLLEKDDVTADALYEKVATGMTASENHEMGLSYFIGQNTTISYSTSYIFLTKASEQGHSASFRCIGDMYNSGKGVQRNHEKATEYYKKSAESQDANENYMCGLTYYDYTGLERNYDIAFIYLTKSSNQGHSYAQVLLGDFYYRGLGVNLDYATAFYYLQKAAHDGNEAGKYRMSTCDFHNQKLNRDEVISWNLKFAQLQDKEDNYTLGIKFYEGRQTAQDLEIALIYFKKSAQQEHYESQRYLGDMYYAGKIVDKNLKTAADYYHLASEKQYGYYNLVLGLQYYNIGNHLGAFIFMDKAAEQGNILAIRHLGDFYYFGYGVDTSKVKGLEYHRKSAVKSSSKNNYKLGMEYYYGKGVEKCYPISFVYFQNAADHGHGESQMYLVDMYMNGLGVDMDTSVASIYLRKMIHQTSSEKQEYPVFLSFSKANIENSSEGYVDYSNESADGAAIEYHKHAAEQQNSFENFMIGTNYHYGANGEQNDSFALIYLTKAKEQGQTGAQKILDSILKNQTNEAG